MLANAFDETDNTVWFYVTGETCTADLTNDDVVDGADLSTLLAPGANRVPSATSTATARSMARIFLNHSVHGDHVLDSLITHRPCI